MKVFVAATLSSGPAASGKTISQAEASGEVGAFVIATVSAPELRAALAQR